MLQEDKRLKEMVQRIEAGEFEAEVEELRRMDEPALKRLYEERDFETV